MYDFGFCFVFELALTQIGFSGFVPVLFAALRRQQRQPNDTSKQERIPLRGWKVLLFWLPALCDLTATTVRFALFRSWMRLTPFLAYEYRPSLHTGFYLSNDKRRSSVVRWDP